MERLQQLIGKLNEQFEQKADPAQLLITTQLIETELLRLSAKTSQVYNSSKVAVVMPGGPRPYNAVNNGVANTEEVTVKPAPAVQQQEEVTVKEEEPVATFGSGSRTWPFAPLREIPTLAHQQAVKEINDAIATKEYSLNDKLKAEVKEVAHLLTDAPVRDLRRAIGINDRFVFINELFRGDEVMYERSIKTINSFRIFPEAEYWIERELKVKLGWDETKESTRHFYQLVKRRFS
jgi:hypothetical protein